MDKGCDTYMDIYEEDIHPHCQFCIKFQKCTVPSKPGDSCSVIACPLECGAKYHACKSKEHKLLCMNEKVPCINAEYGCPSVMFRKQRAKHLASCPASIIHCSEEWDRWPIHLHDKRLLHPSLDSSLRGHLDVALALRDQRMLRKWGLAASQGLPLANQKFTTSSSLWVFRKWQNSRESSYPPGLEESMCKELCKNCKDTSTLVNTCVTNGCHMPEHQDAAETSDKENSGDFNNKIVGKSEIIPSSKQKTERIFSYQDKSNQDFSINNELPHFNLDDILQLSQFGTIVYHQSAGEGSIYVSVDPTESYPYPCSDHQKNIACQILDLKFRNPSSTPPWCLSLGLDLNLESRSQHPPSNFMYTFLCCQEFRRDEYGWHYKNVHSEIHGGLNGWLLERCPLAQYGCKFARKRFNPIPKGSCVTYNETLESFGVAYSPVSHKEDHGLHELDLNSSKPRRQQMDAQHWNLINLPFDVLQHIVRFLDSFSLGNLSLTCVLLRDVCSTVLKDRGLVHFKWERHKLKDKYTWKVSKYKRWFFSSHFSPICTWKMDEKNSMANHLKVCPYFNRISQKRAFGYGDPRNEHPPPNDKRFKDPLQETQEHNNTTKL